MDVLSDLVESEGRSAMTDLTSNQMGLVFLLSGDAQPSANTIVRFYKQSTMFGNSISQCHSQCSLLPNSNAPLYTADHEPCGEIAGTVMRPWTTQL